jgi:hypothetical protein
MLKFYPPFKPAPILIRVLAIAAVWSIAVVIGWRLRHPVVEITLIVIASCFTILIWTHKGQERN